MEGASSPGQEPTRRRSPPAEGAGSPARSPPTEGARSLPSSPPVEGLHAAQQLLVVAAVDEHLCVVLDRLREHREGPRIELLLLPLLQLLGRHLTLGLVEETPGWRRGDPVAIRGAMASAFSPGIAAQSCQTWHTAGLAPA